MKNSRSSAILSSVTRRGATILVCGELVHPSDLPSHFGATGFSVVRCSEDCEGVLALVQKLNPALLIATQSFIEQLASRGSAPFADTRVLAVLEQDSVEASSNMLRVGCHGVLPPGFEPALLSRAASMILHGEVWAPRRVLSDLLFELLRSNSGNNRKQSKGLTPQEKRISELTALGYKNSAIADALFISTETVRWHKRRLHRKTRKPPVRPFDTPPAILEGAAS